MTQEAVNYTFLSQLIFLSQRKHSHWWRADGQCYCQCPRFGLPPGAALIVIGALQELSCWEPPREDSAHFLAFLVHGYSFLLHLLFSPVKAHHFPQHIWSSSYFVLLQTSFPCGLSTTGDHHKGLHRHKAHVTVAHVPLRTIQCWQVNGLDRLR